MIALVWEHAYDPEKPTEWELYVVNVDGSGYRRLTSFHGSARRPKWSPDGSQIYFDYTPCTTGVRPERLSMVVNVNGGGAFTWPMLLGDSRVQFGYESALSPDGHYVAYSGLDNSGQVGVLRVKALDGTSDRQLTYSAPFPSP